MGGRIMKKAGCFFLCFFLIGCSKVDERVEESIQNEHSQVEAEATQDVMTKEIEVVKPLQLSLKEAVSIQKVIQESFRDTWYWYDVFMPPFEENRTVLAEQLFKFYPEIATENYLNTALRNEIVETCNACDALPFYELPIDQALSMKLRIIDHERFAIDAHYPISIFTPERFVTFTYVLQDQQWKIEELTTEVIRPIEDYTEEDEKRDFQVGNEEIINKKDETWQRFSLLEEAYFYNVEIYNAQKEEELVAYITELLQEVQQLYNELTGMMYTKWPEYEQVVKRFEQMIIRKQEANDALYPVGLTQTLFKQQGELEMRLYKVEAMIKYIHALENEGIE
jgi:hypothetical protein